MRNKRGFTLVEVIIVIALLSIIAGIFAINMTGMLNKNKQKDNENVNNTIISAAKSYISSNLVRVEDLYKGYSYVDINVGELRDEGYLSEDLKDLNTNEIIPDDKIIRITYDSTTGEIKYEIIDGSDGDNNDLIRYTLIAKDLFLDHDDNASENWCEKNNNPLKDLGTKDILYFVDNKNNIVTDYTNITVVNKPCNISEKNIGNYTIEYDYTYRDSKDELIKATTTRRVYVIPDKYNLSYNANSGEAVLPETRELTWSQEYRITNVIPTKIGYTFLGWSYDKNATKGTYQPNQSIIFKPRASSKNVTLYAIWEANKYTIVYNANNGNGSMENTVCTYDQDCVIKAHTFTRTDYTYLGWSRSETGGVFYADNQTVKNIATEGTVNLYARWRYNCKDTITGDKCVANATSKGWSYTDTYEECHWYSYDCNCHSYSCNCTEAAWPSCTTYCRSGGAMSEEECEEECYEDTRTECDTCTDCDTCEDESCHTYSVTRYYCGNGWKVYSGNYTTSNLKCYMPMD